MATTNTNSFDSTLASGTAITTSNGSVSGRAFDNVTGTCTYDSTHANSGTLAMKVDMASGTTSQVRWIDGADQTGADSYIRFYLYMTANPSVNTKVAFITTHGNAFNMIVRVNTDGTVTLTDSVPTSMGSTTATIGLNQWVRIEAKVTANASTGSGVLRLYNDADSDTPTETITSAASFNTGSANPGQWRFGGNSSTSSDVFWIDDIKTSDTDWIGAYVAPAALPDFPTDPADLDIEVNLDGTWTNLRTGGYVLDRGITISRGRSDEAGQIEPSKLTMTLLNTDGRFSPRNPTGPYFGKLGRNTPVRASVTRGSKFMELRSDGDEATCPDASALGTTDIDVRIDITTDQWTSTNLCGKWETTGDERSWALQVQQDGTLGFIWSSDGGSTNEDAVISTVPIPLHPGRLAIRFTLDVDDGSSGHAAKFYTSDTISGSWTQLGDTITSTILEDTGTITVFDSTAGLEVGDVADVSSPIGFVGSRTATGVVGRVNAFQLMATIGGSAVANPDFTSQTLGATSFYDTASTPNLWTLGGDATITNRRWRFHGELSTLPPRGDISGNDVYVPAEANGILRRLRQANSPLKSSIFRAISAESSLVEYWPCTDSSDATSIASAIQGHKPMTVSGTPDFAASNQFAASESLPQINKSKWTGNVPAYTVGTTGTQARFLVDLSDEDALPANNTVIASVITNGSAVRWDVVYLTASGGGLSWQAFGNKAEPGSDDQLFSTGSSFDNLNGTQQLVSVDLVQDGSDIDAACSMLTLGKSGGGGLLQTVTGRTIGRITQVIVDPDKTIETLTIGHISVHDTVTDLGDLADQLVGYDGEAAGRRVERLCSEEGISFRAIGDIENSAPMGTQKPGSISDLWQECADADQGMLFEPRDMLGIGYRTLGSLYNQPTRLTLDYDSEEVSDALDATDDDQQVRNDITVTRASGSYYRTELTTGPLSTQAPPNGVGRYDDSVTVNLHIDDQLSDHAMWRLHLGTVDEARYPTIGADFAGPGFIGDDDLNEAMLSLEVGDKVTVTNPPSWLPPDDINQLVQGMSESYENYQHKMSFNTSPESPYHVGVLATSRVDTSGSELAEAATSSATSLTVSTTEGTEWTTDADYFPFDVVLGGEVVTVSAIAGSEDINDSFTRTDSSTTLGSTDTGESWTADVNTWGISSNKAYAVNSSNSIAVVDSGETDLLRVQVTVSTWASGEAWVNVRYADSSNRVRVGGTVGSALQIQVVVAGSVTVSATATGTLAAGDVIACKCVGSYFVAFQNGVEVAYLYDNSNLTGTKVGLQTQNNAVRFDDFSVSKNQIFTVTRGVNGVTKAQTAGTAVSLADPSYIAL